MGQMQSSIAYAQHPMHRLRRRIRLIISEYFSVKHTVLSSFAIIGVSYHDCVFN